MTVEVFVAVDDALFARGVCGVLQDAGLRVRHVVTVTDLPETRSVRSVAVACEQTLRPVLDWRRNHPAAGVVAVVIDASLPAAQSPLVAEADATVSRGSRPERLVDVVRHVAAGWCQRPRTAAQRTVRTQPSRPGVIPDATLLAELVTGATVASLAARHNCSPRQFQRHLARLYRSLGVARRSEAVAVALRREIAQGGHTSAPTAVTEPAREPHTR